MNEFNPKVSIIIPVYNGSNYMKEAIDSALAQTYKNVEVIVINDGSNDEGKTREIALSYGNKIKYFEKENGGVSTALNLGIEKMAGDYFSWLSHDDVYYSNKVQEQINFLNHAENKKIVVYSNYDYIDAASKLLSCYQIKKYRSSESFLIHLLLLSDINGCTLLIPREIIQQVGVFKPELRVTQDYDMWFRIGLTFPFYWIDQPLVKSRIHLNQTSILENPHHYKESELLYQFYLENIPEELIIRNLGMKGFYKIALSLKIRGYFVSAKSAYQIFQQKNFFTFIVFYCFANDFLIKLRKVLRKKIRDFFIKTKIINLIHRKKKVL